MGNNRLSKIRKKILKSSWTHNEQKRLGEFRHSQDMLKARTANSELHAQQACLNGWQNMNW